MGGKSVKSRYNVSQKTRSAIERLGNFQPQGTFTDRQQRVQQENPELLEDLLGEMEAYVANNGFFKRLWRAVTSFSTKPLFDSNIDRVAAILERFQRAEESWQASHIMRHLTADVVTYRGVYGEPLGREERVRLERGSAGRPLAQYQTVPVRWNEEGRAFLRRLWDRLRQVPATASPSMRPGPFPAYRHPRSPLLHLAIGYDQGEEVIRPLVRKHIQSGTRGDLKVLAEALRHHAYGNPMHVSYDNGPYNRVQENVIYRHPSVIDWMLEEIAALAPLQKMQILHLLYREIRRNPPLQSELYEKSGSVLRMYEEALQQVSKTVDSLSLEDMVFLAGAQRELQQTLNKKQTEHLITLLNTEAPPSNKQLRELFSRWECAPETLSRIPTPCFAFLARLSSLYAVYSEPERTVFKALPVEKKLRVITAYLLPERHFGASCSTDSTVKIVFDRILSLNPTSTQDIASLILADPSLHEALLTEETLNSPASLTCFIKYNRNRTMKRETLNRVCTYLEQEHVAQDERYQEIYTLLASLKDDLGKPCYKRLTPIGEFFAAQKAHGEQSSKKPGQRLPDSRQGLASRD
ncbi:hypothetical protein E3226_003235 [Legionella geestiana]|uniref:hypothetical protein n=1 Tax=Legionella geestiana TaxID=45065 RepID=UPI0010933259|nr:hypothetical protein [Legionella geestiana]QDQ39481.1 hypothetical protein E3226_003235 [Legionella geestiana]